MKRIRNIYNKRVHRVLVVSLLFILIQCSFSPLTFAKSVELELLSMFSAGEPLQQWTKKAIEEYEAENPNVNIKPTWAGREVLTKLRGFLLAGIPPNIVDQSTAELTAALVVNDLAYPLNEALETKAYDRDIKWRDTFIPSILEQTLYKGKIYILPRETYTSGFFYNIGMFKDFGLNVPNTWKEFLAVCENLEGRGISPLAADGTVPFYNYWYFSWFAIRIAGPEKLYNAAFDKTGKAWNDPDFLRAAQKLYELVKKDCFIKGYQGSNWPSAQIGWVQGKSGMLLCGAWIPTEMAPQMPPGFKTEIFPFPIIEEGKGNDVAEAWSNGWVILKDSKNPEVAVDVLKFFSSKRKEEEIVGLGSPVPLVGASYPPGTKGQEKIFQEASRMVPKWAGLETDTPELNKIVLWAADDELFFGKITPKEFIEKLVREQKKFYERKR